MLVITSLGIGGAERLLTALADQYVAAGHGVMLVRFHGEAELRPCDPKVQLANLKMRRSPLGVILALGRFRRLIQAFRPDVVNSHLVHANILTRLLRLITPMPRLVSSAHNTNEEGAGRMLAYRLTDRLVDISTNVSQQAVKVFESQGALRPGRMLAINNGIDTHGFCFDLSLRELIREELSLDRSTPLLLAVGRLSEAKDYPNLLSAFSHLVSGFTRVRLAIVGDGPMRYELEAMAQSLGVFDRVYFLGARHDVQALISASDVYVMSSAWEGLPMVILEAMACERPVVATDCGAIRAVLSESGFIVQPRDSRALAMALGQVLQLPQDELFRLGKSARQRVVERYSLEATAEQYLAVYEGQDLPNKTHLQGTL